MERLHWLDISKGFAILLVIIGHIFEFRNFAPLSPITKWVYSFHMPIFFLLAGYTFNVNKYTIQSLVKKKAKRLLLPYFLWGFIAYCVFLCGYIANRFFNLGVVEFEKFNLLKPILGLLYGKVVDGYLPFVMQPLWFLICLFCTQIVFYILYKLLILIHGTSRKHPENIQKTSRITLLLFFIILTFFASQMSNVYLPFSLDSMIMIMPFFISGIILKKIEILEYLQLHKKVNYIIMFLSLISSIYFSQLNTFVTIATNQYGNILYYYIASASGILFVLTMSQIISKCSILEYYGANSLIIFVTHMIFIFIIKGLFVVFFHIGYEDLFQYPSYLIIIFFIILLVEVYVINLINKYIPLLAAKYKKE